MPYPGMATTDVDAHARYCDLFEFYQMFKDDPKWDNFVDWSEVKRRLAEYLEVGVK